MTIAVIGIGLIGGSMMIDLRKRGFVNKSGGFESTVRLAKSNGETWASIFLENSEFIIEVMDTYIEKMNLFRKIIAERNPDGLKALMDEANKIRKILNLFIY